MYYVHHSLAVGILVFWILASFVNTASGSGAFSRIHVFNVINMHRAAQGIATDTYHLFLTTSINEFGKRENIISVYDMDGKFVKEKRNASNIVDRDGRHMDFGDAFAINGSLYITLYNWSSLSQTKCPQYSKIAVFDTKNLSLIRVYDIGGNTAEGITHRAGNFWVTFHDTPIIKEFDRNFKLLKVIPLEIPTNIEIRDGYFQGMAWYGKDIFINLHGPNNHSSFYSPGVIRYHHNGSEFIYVETLAPPTYGSGQGLDAIRSTFYFVDRPANVIIKTNFIELGSEPK